MPTESWLSDLLRIKLGNIIDLTSLSFKLRVGQRAKILSSSTSQFLAGTTLLPRRFAPGFSFSTHSTKTIFEEYQIDNRPMRPDSY
jgi:hypothetical protein